MNYDEPELLELLSVNAADLQTYKKCGSSREEVESKLLCRAVDDPIRPHLLTALLDAGVDVKDDVAVRALFTKVLGRDSREYAESSPEEVVDALKALTQHGADLLCETNHEYLGNYQYGYLRHILKHDEGDRPGSFLTRFSRILKSQFVLVEGENAAGGCSWKVDGQSFSWAPRKLT